jgi:hypothetical protein
MGEVVGAGLLSHVPTIMLSEQDRRDLTSACMTFGTPTRGSMLRVKGSDTLCPGLVTGWDFHSKRIRTYVNGVRRPANGVGRGPVDRTGWRLGIEG